MTENYVNMIPAQKCRVHTTLICRCLPKQILTLFILLFIKKQNEIVNVLTNHTIKTKTRIVIFKHQNHFFFSYKKTRR